MNYHVSKKKTSSPVLLQLIVLLAVCSTESKRPVQTNRTTLLKLISYLLFKSFSALVIKAMLEIKNNSNFIKDKDRRVQLKDCPLK